MRTYPGIIGSGGGTGDGFIFPPLGAYSGITALAPTLVGQGTITVPLGAYSGITAFSPEIAEPAPGFIVPPLGAYSGITAFEPVIADPAVGAIFPPLGAYSGVTPLAPELSGEILPPLGAYSGVTPLVPILTDIREILPPLGAYSGVTALSPTLVGEILPPLGAYSGITALLPTIAEQSSGTVLLDAWTQESTALASPGSKAVSSGSDRLLLVRTLSRGSPGAVTLTAVSYGGQAMTLEQEVLTTTGPDLQVAIWSLDEAGIAAAVGTAFTTTPSSGVLQFRLWAASYENVDQTTPILDKFGASNEAGANPTSQAMNTANNGIALATLGANRGTSDAGATEDASYSNMTELLEDTATQSYSSIGTANTDGTNFTPGTTLTHETAGALIGLTLQPPIPAGNISPPLGAYSGITAFAPTLTGEIVVPLGTYSGITAFAPTIAEPGGAATRESFETGGGINETGTRESFSRGGGINETS